MKSFFAAALATIAFAQDEPAEEPAPLLAALEMATAFEGPAILDGDGNKTLSLTGSTGVMIIEHTHEDETAEEEAPAENDDAKRLLANHEGGEGDEEHDHEDEIKIQLQLMLESSAAWAKGASKKAAKVSKAIIVLGETPSEDADAGRLLQDEPAAPKSGLLEMRFESKYKSKSVQTRTLVLTAGSSAEAVTDLATAEAALSGSADKQEFSIVEGNELSTVDQAASTLFMVEEVAIQDQKVGATITIKDDNAAIQAAAGGSYAARAIVEDTSGTASELTDLELTWQALPEEEDSAIKMTSYAAALVAAVAALAF